MSGDVVRQILTALLAIVLGVAGSLALYIALDFLVNLLPRRLGNKVRPWVFLGPLLAILGFYLVFPTFNTIYLSFLDARSENFVGLENYLWAFTSRDMHIAFRNNLLWIVVVTSATVGLGLLIAVLVDRVSYEPVAKSLIFLPIAISFVGASVIFRFVYAFKPPGVPQIGLLNGILVSLGFDPIPWLIEQPWINNLALMGVMIWLQTGFAMVVLSAGLKSIPAEILEAARVDGANEWQVFWRIIVPMLSSTIAVVATTMVINVLKVFDIVLVMTNGNFGTEVLANRMVKEMFAFRNFGRGSTVAVILLLAIIPIMVINIRRFQEQEAIR